MNIYIYIMKNLPWIKKNSHKDFREDITAVSVRRQSFCPSWWFHTCRCSEQQGPEWHNDTNTGEDGWLTNTLLLNMTLLWISQHYSVTPVQQHISECSFNKLKNPSGLMTFFSLLWHWPQGLRVPYFLVLSNFKCMCVSVFTPQIYFTLGLPCTDWLND